MPAKKKSIAHDAEKAELLRQAELRKLAEEQERLRKIEAEARQRVEEEWVRVMEDQRQREASISRAITEREMRLAFEKREQELSSALECKDCEVRELRAKLTGIQQSVGDMMQERESALRRAGMIANELELAQMRIVDLESALSEKERESHAQLHELRLLLDEAAEEHRGLKVEHQRLLRAHEEQQEQLNAMQAEQATGAAADDKRLATVDPQSTDAETALLLKVLNEEVEKHREVARLLQAELEQKGRDDEKGSVLITLLNSQLESSRDECKRLHDLSTDRLKQLESLQSLLDAEREKTKGLYRDLDKAHAEMTVERRQLMLEIGVHTAQVNKLTEALEKRSAELTEVKEQFSNHREKAAEREQYDFQVNVNLKGEVEELKKDLNKVTEALRVATDEAYSKKAIMRAEIASLQTRLKKLQENAEKNDRESFETIAVLRASNERLQREKDTLTQTTNESLRQMKDEIKCLCDARDGFKALAEKLQVEKDTIEKELFEKLLRMTANHDRLHEELGRVTMRHEQREKEFVENAIFLNAEKETLKAKVEELKEKLDQRSREHAEHIQSITDELNNLRSKAEKQLAEKQSVYEVESARATSAEENVKTLKDQVTELEMLVAARVRERNEVERALKKEASELRLELSAAKRTIERFECALGDTSYKSLCEANERMRRDLEYQRERVAVLNDTIASMKVESSIMETYKEKMLTEQNEQYARYIQREEKLRQIMNPLFYELRSIVERNGLAEQLRRDLDIFDEYVRKSYRSTAQDKRTVAQASHFAEGAASSTEAKNTVSSAVDCRTTLPAVGCGKQPMRGDIAGFTFIPRKPAAPTTQQSTSTGELPTIY